MQDDPCLSLLLLTEDGAQNACLTIEALVHKMLHLVDGKYRKNRIDFQPQNDRSREAMQGNIWKSSKREDRPKLVDLGRSIATKLLERDEEPGFVLFHFDGDCAWSKRKRECQNINKFEAFVVRFVEQVVVDTLHSEHEKAVQLAVAAAGPTKKKASRRPDITAAKAMAMSRLIRLTPFYSIEAWLFQNTVEARRLCQKSRCGRHLEKIAGWESARGMLDELPKIKDELPCLEDRHNHQLAATSFPYHEAESAGKSYAETVARLRECPDLPAALARTWA